MLPGAAKGLDVKSDAGFGSRELDDVGHARGLGGVDESALGLQHLLACAGDHQNAFDTLERRVQYLGSQHVAFDELHRRQVIEPHRVRLDPVPDQASHSPSLPRELPDHVGAARARHACHQDHKTSFGMFALNGSARIEKACPPACSIVATVP